jgi:hypothetical protein
MLKSTPNGHERYISSYWGVKSRDGQAVSNREQAGLPAGTEGKRKATREEDRMS